MYAITIDSDGNKVERRIVALPHHIIEAAETVSIGDNEQYRITGRPLTMQAESVVDQSAGSDLIVEM